MSALDKDTINALRKFKQLQEQSNETFLPLFWDTHRHLVLCGGAGSGKSIFAGRKVLERITSEGDHRLLVCRKIARTLRESCFRQLIGQISEHYKYSDFTINKTDMQITYNPNGSQILFAGLDDVEKLKSIYRVTGIWIEEGSELLESDYDQLNIRLRGETKYYKQIITTFNPIDINHWLKRRFFDKHDNKITAHRSTYRDNRFLDDEAKEVLESFKDTDPYYYSVYCLGEWGVWGKTIFNAESVAQRLRDIKKPIKTGYFTYDYNGVFIKDIKFVESDDGYIKIYEEPINGCPYVIGGDTAGEGSDNFTAQVINNITLNQCATLKRTLDSDIYAQQQYCLGKYYNDALIGIENNFDTHPIRELERLGYRNQYYTKRPDVFTHQKSSTWGFKTTSVSRPLIISMLVQFAKEHINLINDRDTLEEMLTFVRNEKGRPEAQNGAHDDLIIALAIAYHIRSQQIDYIDGELIPKHYDFDFQRPKQDTIIGGDIIVY